MYGVEEVANSVAECAGVRWRRASVTDVEIANGTLINWQIYQLCYPNSRQELGAGDGRNALPSRCQQYPNNLVKHRRFP